MIQGLGLDAVEIERFASWHTKSIKELSSVFSANEISYALASPAHSAERFAARFAAKEALYKALSTVCSAHSYHLRGLCKAVEIIHASNGTPSYGITWELLPCGIKPKSIHLSITHTKTVAIAVALITQ